MGKYFLDLQYIGAPSAAFQAPSAVHRYKTTLKICLRKKLCFDTKAKSQTEKERYSIYTAISFLDKYQHI